MTLKRKNDSRKKVSCPPQRCVPIYLDFGGVEEALFLLTFGIFTKSVLDRNQTDPLLKTMPKRRVDKCTMKRVSGLNENENIAHLRATLKKVFVANKFPSL